MTDIAEALLPQINTIRGDLRDLMLGALSQMNRLWKDMPEAEQLGLAQVMDAHAQAIVTRIAIMTATAGRPAVLVNLDSLAIGEKAKGTFSVSKDQAAALVQFTDQIVAVMPIGPNQFMGQRAPVQTQPDQPTLPMGEPAKVETPAPKTIVLTETYRRGDVRIFGSTEEFFDGERWVPVATTPPPVMQRAKSTPEGGEGTKKAAKPKATKPKPNGKDKKFGSPFAR